MLLDWCWSWNSSTLATSCEELTHWKRPWCWEGLGAGGEGDDRGWDGWMASPTRWTWVWVNSCWELVMDKEAWHAVIHGVAKRVGHDWVTELNWTETFDEWFSLFGSQFSYLCLLFLAHFLILSLVTKSSPKTYAIQFTFIFLPVISDSCMSSRCGEIAHRDRLTCLEHQHC